MTTQSYRLRPGTWSDLPRAAELYTQAFSHDKLIDLMFPWHKSYPAALNQYLISNFQQRHWTLGWRFVVLVDSNDHPVGFTWWNRGISNESFYQRWLSPFAWFAPIVRKFLSIRDYFFGPAYKPNMDAYKVLVRELKNFGTTPRRRSAFYLSTLAVDPKLQGKGLGAILMQDGIEKVDEAKQAAILCRLKNLDGFYGKFGFRDMGNTAVDELSEWDGGQIMLRD